MSDEQYLVYQMKMAQSKNRLGNSYKLFYVISNIKFDTNDYSLRYTTSYIWGSRSRSQIRIFPVRILVLRVSWKPSENGYSQKMTISIIVDDCHLICTHG